MASPLSVTFATLTFDLLNPNDGQSTYFKITCRILNTVTL